MFVSFIAGGLGDRSYQWNGIRGLSLKFVGQFFVVGDEMGDVNVAVVLFHQDVLSDLVSVHTWSMDELPSRHAQLPVDEGIVESEF